MLLPSSRESACIRPNHGAIGDGSENQNNCSDDATIDGRGSLVRVAMLNTHTGEGDEARRGGRQGERSGDRRGIHPVSQH